MKKFLLIILSFACLVPPATAADKCTAGNCVNGKGTMVYSTGQTYTGEFKDGVRNGEGVLLLPGSRKIVGIWENDEIKEIKGDFDGNVFPSASRIAECLFTVPTHHLLSEKDKENICASIAKELKNIKLD